MPRNLNKTSFKPQCSINNTSDEGWEFWFITTDIQNGILTLYCSGLARVVTDSK